jgi:hypothetical protein
MRYIVGMLSSARNIFVSITTCLLILSFSGGRSQTKSTQSSIGTVSGTKKDEIEAAVAIICATDDIIRAKNGSISGCHKCPEGTGFRQFHSDDEWVLGRSLAGHFTSAQDNNLILVGFECESIAMNNGGSFVFLMNAGKPQLLMYDEGLIADDCHKFPHSDGREFLVCRGGHGGQGYETSNIFLTEFDAAGKGTETSVFSVFDSTGACDDISTKAEYSDILDIKYSTKRSGQLTGMIVNAFKGRIPCRDASKELDPLKLPASVKTYQIEFTFDGKQFVVAPKSRAAFNLFPRF